jgi:hypothetical protein
MAEAEDADLIDERDIQMPEVVEGVDPKELPDYLVRTQTNALTQTTYYLYDCRKGSEIFDLQEGEKYVVAIPETGEYKAYATRSEVTKPGSGAMYPWAKWSVTEQARMRIIDCANRISHAVNACIEGQIDVELLEWVADRLYEAMPEDDESEGDEEE